MCDLIGLQSVLETKTFSELPSLIGESTGSFTASVLDCTTETTYLFSDPLGGGMLFGYEDENVTAFGFDIESLRNALSRFGFATKRDVLFELGSIAVGTGYLGADSPVEEFQLLRPGVFVELRPDGTHSRPQLSVDSRLYGSNPREYEELIDNGVRDVRENANSVAVASQGDIYADITGGFDSRLVVAGLNNARVLDNVSLYSLKSSDEWETACGIARVCGRPISWLYPVSSVVEEKTNFVSSCLEGSRDSSGTINHSTRDFAGRSPVTSLSGGYGETFRDFYLVSEQLLEQGVTGGRFVESVFSKYPIYSWSVGEQRIFTAEFESHLKKRIDGFFDCGRNAGAREDQLGNYLYLKGRNRFWIGQLAYWASRAQLRYDILYSIDLIAAANTLDRYRRRANFVGWDAMRKMAPYLMNYPFHGSGHDRIPAVYRKEKFNPPRYHFPSGGSEIVSPKLKPRFLRDYEIATDEITESDRAHAINLGITPAQAYGLRNFVGEAVEALSHPALSGYINRHALESSFRSSLKSRASAQIALKFIPAFVRLGLVANDLLYPEDRTRFEFQSLS